MRRKLHPAFTLIEVMVALALIMIILAVVIPNFMVYRSSTHVGACETNLNMIQRACEMHYLRTGAVLSDVNRLCDSSTGGIYLKMVPKCPLGGKYEIEWDSSQQHFHVTCSAFDTAKHNVHQDGE